MTDAANPTAPEAPAEKPGFLRGVYNYFLRLAGSKQAEPALFALSFAESSFFPIPPDVMLAPMSYANPQRAYRFALVCTIASVLGAIAGYGIGYLLFEAVGSKIIGFLGYAGKEDSVKALYDEWGMLATLVAGFTPIPYKLVTIISGAMEYALLPFIAASAVARGARFFLVAWLFKTFGPAMAPVIEKRIGLFSVLFVVVLVGAIVAVKFLH